MQDTGIPSAFQHIFFYFVLEGICEDGLKIQLLQETRKLELTFNFPSFWYHI